MKLLKKFYSRSFLLLIIAGVIVLYVTVVFASYRYIEFKDKSSQKSIVAEQKAKFEKLSKEEQAIKKAEEYLAHNITLVKIEQRLFLDYLQRKFDLDEKLSVKISPFTIPENPQTYPQEIHFLSRIAYPNNLVKVQKPRNIVDGPLLTNIYSANCDHIPLPSNYWQTMEDNYKLGAYYLTHNALAFAFMKDNGCAIPPDKDELKEKVTAGMVQIASDQKSIADLRYEAVALLLLNDKYDAIEESWINEIMVNQLKDGSWAEKKGDTTSSDHTTVLAAWALLEYSRPNTPDEPIILRPSTGR